MGSWRVAYYSETVLKVQACRLAQSHQYNVNMRDHNNHLYGGPYYVGSPNIIALLQYKLLGWIRLG